MEPSQLFLTLYLLEKQPPSPSCLVKVLTDTPMTEERLSFRTLFSDKHDKPSPDHRLEKHLPTRTRLCTFLHTYSAL